MVPRITALLLAIVLLPQAATAKTYRLVFTEPTEKQSTGPLRDKDAFLVSGQIRSAINNPVTSTLTFRAETASITVSLAWNVGDRIRLVGVNLDLLNRDGSLVASDTFMQLVGDVAVSSLTADVVPGQTYRLVLTGTQQGAAHYMMSVESPPAP
jgi:hypothetical protein